MDVNERNRLFAGGAIDRADLWPKITEYEEQLRTLRFSFGLDTLPRAAGIVLIRGPRQFGKSTWLELQLHDTLREFGPGSACFLNGDDVTDAEEETSPQAPRRSRALRHVLVVTAGRF